jgi:CBS domain-containing protein
MHATVLAVLVASFLSHDSIMTEKLTRRGLRVPSDYHADVLRTTPVATVMTVDVATVDECASVAIVADRFRQVGHGAYPVVDADGHCVGMISRGDLLREAGPDGSSPVGKIASRDVVAVRSDDSVVIALERMLEEDVEHLPVIDDGRLVGICTRTDVLRARKTQFAHEQTEPGWLPLTRHRRNST